VPVIGGGLAGCEAAWALAERRVRVNLHEMRPVRMTPAHQTDRLAELVCSNTFKSVEPTHAHGLLKTEMRQLGSIVLQAADEARIPGGSALAVDRVVFATRVQERVLGHPNITLVRGEVTELPSPGIIATGPLTSDALAAAIARRLGAPSLAFYDAIAPIVSADSLDYGRLFKASRYGKGAATTTGTRRSLKASTKRSWRRSSRAISTRRGWDMSLTRSPISRAACRSRKWRSAGSRHCALGR